MVGLLIANFFYLKYSEQSVIEETIEILDVIHVSKLHCLLNNSRIVGLLTKQITKTKLM